MGRASGDALDGANAVLEAAEIERIDDAPDTAGDMVVIDQAIDVEKR